MNTNDKLLNPFNDDPFNSEKATVNGRQYFLKSEHETVQKSNCFGKCGAIRGNSGVAILASVYPNLLHHNNYVS